jgi:hypothetical protein
MVDKSACLPGVALAEPRSVLEAFCKKSEKMYRRLNPINL